jgi:class 3 adenylate cyclase
VDIHKALRDLALKQNDLATYVHHNNEYTRITEEINGRQAATKVAMQSKQREIDAERRDVEKRLSVLHATLPAHVVDRIARNETVSDHDDNAAVIFLDIVGFTTISDRLASDDVVLLLERFFSTLDAVCAKHNVVKIKTIGDSYMAVAFSDAAQQQILRAAECAIEMIAAVRTDTLLSHEIGEVAVRIGVHSGPVTAGVIGTTRLQYDVWGDTVNVASRMESTGEPGRIHVSEAFAHSLTPCLSDTLTLVQRGEISIKGKGTMTTFWLESTST